MAKEVFSKNSFGTDDTMKNTPHPLPSLFGVVDLTGEHGLFSIDFSGRCKLTLLERTERGYPRRELATIPGEVWKIVQISVQNEFVRVMDDEEQGEKSPSFHTGDNALSPLITRELAVLLWAFMEDAGETHVEALVTGWRHLAREERWWLYARASNPAQQKGVGWRRALYYALSDPTETRTPQVMELVEHLNKKAEGIEVADSAQPKALRKKRQVKASEKGKKERVELANLPIKQLEIF